MTDYTVCQVCGNWTGTVPTKWETVVKDGVTLLIPCHRQEAP